MESALPTVSLIIPVYNTGRDLQRCLDSIAAQDTEQWEAICIDDGSTDGSTQVLDTYHANDSRFVVIHQKNSGVSHARNVGIEHAQGAYIAFIDADDWVEPRFVSELLSGSDSGKFDYIAGGYEVHHIEEKHCRLDTMAACDTEVEDGFSYAFLSAQSPYPWGKLLRRSIITRHHLRFNEDMKIGEDTLFCYQFLSHSQNGSTVRKALYHYYEGGGAWSRFARGLYPTQEYRHLYRIVSFLLPAIQRHPQRNAREEWGKELLRQTRKLQNLLSECSIPWLLKYELKITGWLIIFQLILFIDRKLFLPVLRSILRPFKTMIVRFFASVK